MDTLAVLYLVGAAVFAALAVHRSRSAVEDVGRAVAVAVWPLAVLVGFVSGVRKSMKGNHHEQ